jgi:MFS family permease
MNQLIAFRALQGVGCAAMFAIPQSIACDIVSIEERPKYQVIFELTMSIANGMGPLLGGLIADADWRCKFSRNFSLMRS